MSWKAHALCSILVRSTFVYVRAFLFDCFHVSVLAIFFTYHRKLRYTSQNALLSGPFKPSTFEKRVKMRRSPITPSWLLLLCSGFAHSLLLHVNGQGAGTVSLVTVQCCRVPMRAKKNQCNGICMGCEKYDIGNRSIWLCLARCQVSQLLFLHRA